MGKKRAAPQPSTKANTKQTTLGDAFAKKARAGDDAPPPPSFEQIECSHRTVKEKLLNTARPFYDKYCERSALMKGATDTETSTVHKTANKRATRSRTSMEADADIEEESLDAFDPSWEKDGLTFVTMLEPLVSPVHGLQRYLQEFLVHIVLNHERHHTDLSMRALRLLMRNAKCHPPCSIPEDAPPGQLRVNKELWVPSDRFKFAGSKCPLILANKHPLDVYLDLWKIAHESSSQSTKHVPFGHILLLEYSSFLIHTDLDVRLCLVQSPQCRGYQKSEEIMKDSILWQTLCTGVGSASAHQMWLGSNRNSVALLQSLVLTFLRSKQKPGQQQQQARTNRRSSSQTPQQQSHVAGTPQGAASTAARLSSTPMGAMTPGVADAQLPNKAPLSVHELGAMASKTLRLWQNMYALADSASGPVLDRSIKGTDLFYLCEHLHQMLTGHARNQDSDPLARTINGLLKGHDEKLALLSVFTPEARLTLLSMQFLDMALKAWTDYAQPSGSSARAMASEGVGVLPLPSGVKNLQDYLERKGLDRSGQAQVDPLQVLACLAPPEARQAAAATVPYLEDAVKGGISDLYTQAKKSLLKVDTHTKDCTGFTLWLSTFSRAAVELQQQHQVQPAEAVALRSLVRSLNTRMDADNDSSFTETLLAQCTKVAMLKAV
ncbi:hypothetical protein DUNSADRAFT_16065 [Dunaliella salina]|uniref:Uncharacterized protein n=1 Tax=Dunaliella salina TaxID=3046 RepID=A0ABQ7G4A6_DUNSA|nr:hypothetical protein DUNSADRAFT_16065 [Dunaliella salina]|eukprot:KAF5829441.1 hypothetical protein DUNSADRAFT_16065 [Dunaliella salina]